MSYPSYSEASGDEMPDADVVDRSKAGERDVAEDVVDDYNTGNEWDDRDDVKAAKAQRAKDLEARRENPNAAVGRASNPDVGGEG